MWEVPMSDMMVNGYDIKMWLRIVTLGKDCLKLVKIVHMVVEAVGGGQAE